MKTLYIHGLDSFPIPEKKKILAKAGLDVVALHINYRQKLGIYEILKDAVIQKNVQFIIGSSLGGFLGYWLAEDMGLPCLLFNPAMSHKRTVFYSKIPVVKDPKCPARYVVLGAQDDLLDAGKTLAILKKNERDGLHQQIITCDWLGHQIDLFTFDEMVNWAVYSLKINGYKI
jgi:hypothetical protein